jgi:predicted nucleic acid-binding protein
MKLVVDASVVVKWYVVEIDSEAAERLLAHEGFEFCVPAHAFGEIGNALATYVRRGLLPRSQVPEIGRRLASHVTSYPVGALLPVAVDIALEIGSTVYDALYIALAAELETAVATADERLVQAASKSSWHERVRPFAALLQS